MNDSLLVILVIPLAGLVAGIFAAVYPMIQSARAAKILKDQLKNGPYDDATIERSTYCYIKPRCSNIDPAQEQEIRHALMATSEDLFKKVDYFLDEDKSRKHLLILADSGMGKTSFVLNYYVYRFNKRKNRNISIIPLGNPNPEESILKDENKREKIVFLDALDEDTKAIANHAERIKELMDLCRDYKKVIVTCRTQFFPKDEEIPVETGIVKIGPKHLGEGVTYEFWKLYLSPLDDQEVGKYIRKRFPWWKRSLRKNSLNMIEKIPFLSIRPMLLAYIPELLIRGRRFQYSYEIYEEMVSAWISREEFWANKKKLQDFSYLLAKDIYTQRIERGSETINQGEIDLLIKTWNIELEKWQITGRSLLNRNAIGNYKFAHRSIMEYLFSYQLFQGDTECFNMYLNDQIRRFFFDMVNDYLCNLDVNKKSDFIPNFCYKLEVIVREIGNNYIFKENNKIRDDFIYWAVNKFNNREELPYRITDRISWRKKLNDKPLNMTLLDKIISVFDYEYENVSKKHHDDIHIRYNGNNHYTMDKYGNFYIESIKLIGKMFFIKYIIRGGDVIHEFRDRYMFVVCHDDNDNEILKVDSIILFNILDKYGYEELIKLYYLEKFRRFFQIDFENNNNDLSIIVKYNKKAMESC